MKLIDKLWNWGHLEGSHNACTGYSCNMSPEQYAEEYGIARSFIVSYGGNIQPPFHALAKRMKGLKEIKWSVVGDSSSPLPDTELGDTDAVLSAALDGAENITGGVMDDFFSPERMKRFPPEVLMKIRKKLNAQGLDFWCVLYDMQLDYDLEEYLKCFDGVSLWLWGGDKIADMETYLEKFFALTKNNKKMLGVYLWDYAEHREREMENEPFERQVKRYFGLLEEKAIDGVIFCSNTLGDADLETNRILKACIAEYGQREIEE